MGWKGFLCYLFGHSWNYWIQEPDRIVRSCARCGRRQVIVPIDFDIFLDEKEDTFRVVSIVRGDS